MFYLAVLQQHPAAGAYLQTTNRQRRRRWSPFLLAAWNQSQRSSSELLSLVQERNRRPCTKGCRPGPLQSKLRAALNRSRTRRCQSSRMKRSSNNSKNQKRFVHHFWRGLFTPAVLFFDLKQIIIIGGFNRHLAI